MRQVHAGERVDGGVYVDIADATIWHFTAGESYGPPMVLLGPLEEHGMPWRDVLGPLAFDGYRAITAWSSKPHSV